jgi:hypothetical protein
LDQNNIKAMSIQIRLNGLSFCILNRTNNTIEFITHVRLDKKATPYELLNELTKAIDSKIELQQTFDTITCIYQNELGCLIPNELFDENNLAEYLKFNSKILKTDFISFDKLAANNSVNVYIPLVNINNYIFETFGSFDYKHFATILIETLLQKEATTTEHVLYLHINEASFEIIGINNKALTFYNTFEYGSKEDFIYYILFTLEQLQLDPENIKVAFIGGVTENDDLFKILYKYIRFVDVLKPYYNYNIENNLNHNFSDFTLLNSFN